MTTKQFNWLRDNQFSIEVSWIDIYEGKEPKNYHPLYNRNGNLEMLIIGERFYFAGKYYTFNGKEFVEHHAKYDVHYKNIRTVRYRRKH